MWDVKELTPLFEKSRGRRPRWCGQPLRVVGLGSDQPRPQGKPWGRGWGSDGTSHGTSARSCTFPLGRPVSREAGKKKVMMKWQNTFSLFRLQSALRYGKVCRFLTENVPTDRMKNKISRQYFRVLPIRCASREDVFASILYDASCPTALLGGNTFSIKLDCSLVPSRPWRFRK